MKRLSVIAIVVTLLQLGAGSVRAGSAAPFTPTICPKDYTCSLTASGTRPLVGTANDGHPSSLIGVLSFDSESNVSGFLEINMNGTSANFSLTGATCISGTGGKLGQIDFTEAGTPLVIDFVTFSTGLGTGMLFAEATPSATNITSVLVGRCEPVPLVAETR